MYKVIALRQAKKDAVKIKRSGLKPQVDEIIKTVKENPYKPTQNFEKMKGGFRDSYSRRINRQHRFVYTIEPNDENLCDKEGAIYKGIVKIVTMWTHYEQ